jgi:hypothetical protein
VRKTVLSVARAADPGIDSLDLESFHEDADTGDLGITRSKVHALMNTKYPPPDGLRALGPHEAAHSIA